MTDRRSPRQAVRHFAFEEAGSGNITSLFFALVLMAMGGLAIDSANGYQTQAQMQAVADAVALSAARVADDPAEAVARANRIAAANLGSDAEAMFTSADLVRGHYDPQTDTFTPDQGPANAVEVRLGRDSERANALQTSFLRLVGRDSWDIGVTALAGIAETSAQSATKPYCNTATIVTTGQLAVGGGNRFHGKVCLHGEQGFHGGGNNLFDPQVRVSAARQDTITLGHLAPGSGAPEELVVVRSLTPQIVPDLSAKFSRIMTELRGKNGQAYTGTELPDRYQGHIIVEVPHHWVNFTHNVPNWSNGSYIDPLPGHIYVTPGGVQFAGNVDANDIAIIANGQIGVGGGASLSFSDVFFFGTGQLNFAGNIAWGNQGTFCDTGEFNSHLLSTQRVSLGGAAGTFGTLIAAPQVATGGSFQNAAGLYIEADQSYTQLGGDAFIEGGCSHPLDSSVFEIVKPLAAADTTDAANTRRSILLR